MLRMLDSQQTIYSFSLRVSILQCVFDNNTKLSSRVLTLSERCYLGLSAAPAVLFINALKKSCSCSLSYSFVIFPTGL